MKKLALRMLITSIFLLLLSGLSPVFGCSCLSSGPPCEAYWNFDVVFVGRVLTVSHIEVDGEVDKRPQRLFRFQVEDVFRGTKATTIDVGTGSGGGDCGYNFDLGKEYLVYGRSVRGQPWVGVNICSRTQPLSQAAQDLKYIRSLSQQVSVARIFGKAQKLVIDATTGIWKSPAPVVGAIVVAATDEHRFEQVTGSDGTYEFRNVPPGKYTVRATMPAKLSSVENTQVEVHERGCSEINYRVFVDGRIRGRLLNDQGTPLASKSVDLVLASDGASPHKSWAFTEKDGSFEFNLLPPGQYVLGINIKDAPSEALPYKQTFYESSHNRAEASILTLSEGQHLEGVDFRVGPPLIPSHIDGVVVWPDGRPAVGAEVTLTHVDSGRSAKWGVKVDTKGRFSVPAFEQVAYKIEATIPADPTWDPDSGKGVALLTTTLIEVKASEKARPVRLVINVRGDGIQRSKVTVGAKAPAAKPKRRTRP